MKAIIVSLLLGAAMPTATAAAVTQPAEAATKVDGPAVAKEVKRLLSEQYVLTELRPKFAAAIDQGLASGRYNVDQAEVLIERINVDLAKVTSDKHLGVMHDPVRFKAVSAAPFNPQSDDRAPTAEEIKASERKNHGLVEMKILPGNIRYLEIEAFDWVGAPSERAYDSAMAFLAGGNAAIIDIRRNGGGSPEAVRYAVSHFIAPNKPLMTFHMGSRGTQSTASLAATRAPRMIGKPLFVLSSAGSASAAEEFLGHIAGYKLGEIIGERSAGAGFRNEYFVLPSGLLISISVGRAVLASTGKDWEAVGIAPTVETQVDKALDVAKVRALQRIAQTAEPRRQTELRAVAAALNATINPVRTELPLPGYAGVYGERTVQAGDKGLTIRRGDGPPNPLIAVASNRFAYVNDPASTLTFTVLDGKATALHLVRADGSEDRGVRIR